MAAKIKLDQAVIDVLKQPIYEVWNSIAPDMMECCEMSNGDALEACIDADRLITFGNHVAANDLVKQMFKDHDYKTLYKFLHENISLC